MKAEADDRVCEEISDLDTMREPGLGADGVLEDHPRGLGEEDCTR